MSKYGASAQHKIRRVMHEFHEGKLEAGKTGEKVTERKQALAIALSEARHMGSHTGSRVPPKKDRNR